MILGHVRDGFPRITLALPGRERIVTVEFVLDTGFDGELSVPGHVLNDLDAAFTVARSVLLPDNVRRNIRHFQIDLDWNDDERPTEVIALEGRPLLGNLLLEGCEITIDMQDGGEVVIDFP